MAFKPFAEYTITASGVWKLSPGSSFQLKFNGLIPIVTLVTS